LINKKVLRDYIDACAFIKETDAEIKRLESKKRIVQDKVKGSNPEWPYEPRSFNLGGTIETIGNAGALSRERQIKENQVKVAMELKAQVEEWLPTIPFRMQRIIEYKVFNELTWDDVAKLMGRKCTANSVRMEFKRFMEEK
jgi:hypothetical protein